MTCCCCISISVYFFFKRSVAHPDLHLLTHSFPTRRSSDLCSFQFDPIGRNKFDGTSCDIVKAYLARSGVTYANVAAAPGTAATVRIGGEVHKAPDPATLTGAAKADAIAVFQKDLHAGLTSAGYPAADDPAQVGKANTEE